MPHLTTYIGLADNSERTLAESFQAVAQGHDGEADVFHVCRMLAEWSDHHGRSLAPVITRYGEDLAEHPDEVRRPQALIVDP